MKTRQPLCARTSADEDEPRQLPALAGVGRPVEIDGGRAGRRRQARAGRAHEAGDLLRAFLLDPKQHEEGAELLGQHVAGRGSCAIASSASSTVRDRVSVLPRPRMLMKRAKGCGSRIMRAAPCRVRRAPGLPAGTAAAAARARPDSMASATPLTPSSASGSGRDIVRDLRRRRTNSTPPARERCRADRPARR